MFTDLVQKNRQTAGISTTITEPKNIVRLTSQYNGNSYSEGLSVLIQNFESSRYFWHILSDWSRLWHPTGIPFDVIIFKEFDDGTVLTEFCGIEDNIKWIGNKRVLHNDPIDHKFILRIYKCYPDWDPLVDRPAAYINAGSIDPNSIVKLIASNMITGGTDKKFFFETIDNYCKYHNVGLEHILENFWYTVWDTGCCALTTSATISSTLPTTTNVSLVDETNHYYQLFELRHRDLIKNKLRTESGYFGDVLEKETNVLLAKYWNAVAGTGKKRAEYFQYLKDEESKYLKFYDSFVPKPIIAKVGSSGQVVMVQSTV